MVDSKAIINNLSSNKLFSRNERFQDSHNQRLKEFLRHHNCDGCIGCSLQDIFQQKKSFMLNENEFNITNNTITLDSEGKIKANHELIDKILNTRQFIDDKNAPNEAKIENNANGPNCSCSSCAIKSNSIEELLGILRKEKIISENEFVRNDLDSSYKKSVNNLHADDCKCDSCRSKRANIENLFKKLEVTLEFNYKAVDNNESISNQKVIIKNLLEKGSDSRNSANYDFSKPSKENYSLSNNSFVMNRDVRVNDYYQSSTHVYVVNQKDKLHEIHAISSAATIQKNTEKSNISSNDLPNNNQKLKENEKDIFVNNFNYSHESRANNISLNQFSTNIRKNEIIQKTSSYNLLSNKKNNTSLIPSFAEVMNIPWLRKLYGHLYGLFEIENIGNKKYLFLHQFFSSMNINKKIKTEDKHIIWESSVLSNRLNSFSEKVGQKILNVQKYSSTFFEHAKRSMFSKMAIINNKVKERMSIYYHKFNVFRIFLSKQLNDFTLKTNYLRFDIMQNFNIFFYQNARKFLNQIKTKVEIDLMKVYLLQKNAIEFTKSYYNFFNELVSVIKFKIQRVAISLRNSSNHYFDFLRDLNQNVKKISIRLLDSALRIIYTVKIKFLNISKYEIIKIKDLRKKLINRLLYLVMLLKIIERQSEDEKSSKSNFIFNVFFIIKSISLNIFNRLKNILFN